MRPRIKKLIVAILTLIWIPVYALIVMGVAVRVLPHANWAVAFLFYALTGTLWIVPIGLTFPWMYRDPIETPDRDKSRAS
jgi:hypothetical protein